MTLLQTRPQLSTRRLATLLAGVTALLCTALLPAPVLAAPDPPPLVGAGTQPTEGQARAAVIEQLKRTSQSGADLLRVRFLSGPHLITGISFAGNREQAWQMCVIEGQDSLRHGTPDVVVKQYFLRNSGKGLAVLTTVNWKSYDSMC
ncbi:hypothetical protein BH11PSE7_BH11PSE7_31300 [soil metagenome]